MSLSSLLGITKSQPAQVIPASITEPKIAEEIAPYLKDILGKGQALYKQRTEEGFVPFEGQTLADVSADQLAAQEGIRNLVGGQAPAFEEARGLTRSQTQQATADTLQPFMNPYQQAVTDIAKRQATEQFQQTTLPGLRKQAVDAGSFGGSRAAMLESQALDNQARLLADIQAKGDLAAFQDARNAFEAQKTRERLAAQGLTGLATGQFGAQTRELGALEAVGREGQQREQQLLDESYKRFLEERQFPEQQLGQYQALVAGTPISQGNITYQQAKFQPSPLSQALGTASAGLGAYETAQKVGLFSKEGGGIAQGLASLPVIKKQQGKQILQQTMNEVSPMTGVSDVGTEEQAGIIANFLKSLNLGPTEKQEEKAKELQDYNVRAQKIRQEQEDAKNLKKQNLMLAKEQTLLDDTIASQVPVNVVPDNTITVNAQPTVIDDVDDVSQNNAGNRVTNVLSNVNTVKEDTTPPEEKPDPRPLDEMRTAVKGLEGLFKDRDAKLTTQEATEKALIDTDRAEAKGEARRKFLVDFGEALLTGDGAGGGFFAEAGKAGVKATKGSQKYFDTLKNLNKEERKIVTDSANRKFNNQVSEYQQKLELGRITLKEYELGIEQAKASLGNYLKEMQLFDSALSTTISLFDKARSGDVNLSAAAGAYDKIRDRLPDDVKSGYDKSFNTLIEDSPEEGLNKFPVQPRRQ
jgi:hypothetical protein|tara:strand:- start:274 stop:2361 length:2088 start_codon:yes stop_codon:yes gene_type:complete